MWIINGKIYTMAGKVYENGYVRIKGKIIDAVGPMEQAAELGLPDLGGLREEETSSGKRSLSSLSGGTRRTISDKEGGNTAEEEYEEAVLDVHGAWVLPGLIEAHAHIGLTEEKSGTIGDDCNEMTNPVLPAIRGLDAVNPMDPAFHDAIQAGITSVMAGPGSANVVGGQFVFMKTHGRCVDDMIVKSPAAMKVAFGENPKTTYGEQNTCPSTRMGTAYMLRKALFDARKYLEKRESGNLEEQDFDLEPWIPVLKKEIPLKAGLDSGGVTLFLIAVFLLCYALNFFMTPLSIFAGVMPPLAAIAMSLPGVNDISVIIVTVHIATINVVLPYETANNLVLYSFDTMSMKDYVKAFALRSLLSFAVFGLALVYWNAIGLLG